MTQARFWIPLWQRYPPSRLVGLGGTLDFRQEKVDEVLEAWFEFDGLQDDLPFHGSGKEGAGDEIRDLIGVA